MAASTDTVGRRLRRARAAGSIAALVLTVVAGGCASTAAEPTAGPAPLPAGSWNGEDVFVAMRAFELRGTPTLSGPTLLRFRTGDEFAARVRRVDEIWTYVSLDGGPEGYVFGLPYQPQPARDPRRYDR